MASRGKMMGLRFDVARRAGAERQVQLCRASKPPSLLATPKDPLVQDMGFADRKYLAYCKASYYTITQRYLLTFQMPATSAGNLSSTTPPTATPFESSYR